MTSPAFDLPAASEEPDPFFDTAARIAAQIATPSGEFLRVVRRTCGSTAMS